MSADESQAGLEREIATLTRRVERAKLELASLRERPEPRGVVPGILAGMVVVMVAFVAFMVWAGVAVQMVTG